MNKFDRDFENMEKTFKVFFGVVATFIAICFIAVISFWIFVGVSISKLDTSEGIKPILNQVWCGKKEC